MTNRNFIRIIQILVILLLMAIGGLWMISSKLNSIEDDVQTIKEDVEVLQYD